MSKRRQEDDFGIQSNKRIRRINNNNNVPVELIHAIQSLLPLKEGVRSCILSKSWLSAWYTLPILKLTPPEDPDYFYITQENQTKYNQHIHTTLHRYHAENTPIQSFLLQYCVIQESYVEDVQNWLRLVVSKSSLKHLSLDVRVVLDEDRDHPRLAWPIYDDDDDDNDNDDDVDVDDDHHHHHSAVVLPNELFSSQALHTIHVSAQTTDLTKLRLGISSTTNVINCVSLRVLHLDRVFIHQDVLNNVLSTCRLLETIKLLSCWFDGLKTVNLKNLLRLTSLDISSTQEDDLWDIHNLPSLSSFSYRHLFCFSKPIPFLIDSLASVIRLCIDGDLVFNSSFFKALEKFHVLESLTLVTRNPHLTDLVFTSASLRWFTLHVSPTSPVVNIQVYAPKLLSFIYTGRIPGLLFPATAPEQVKLTFNTWETLGHSYFLRIRQALNSSSNFVINIRSDNLDVLVEQWNIDVDDLRREAPLSPVGNVELVLETDLDEHAWEQSPFFDAFFLICHPSYIRSSYKVIRKMMEGNTTHPLKEVLLKNPDNGNWEALTTSWKSVLHTLTGDLECKLVWFPQ